MYVVDLLHNADMDRSYGAYVGDEYFDNHNYNDTDVYTDDGTHDDTDDDNDHKKESYLRIPEGLLKESIKTPEGFLNFRRTDNCTGKLKRAPNEKRTGSTGGQRLEIVSEANGWK